MVSSSVVRLAGFGWQAEVLPAYGMNLILISFSATATAVFGIYFKLQSFIFMPVFGLNNGVIPIVAYNYGAQKRDRVLSAIRHVCSGDHDFRSGDFPDDAG